jgi:hypothetical protein
MKEKQLCLLQPAEEQDDPGRTEQCIVLKAYALHANVSLADEHVKVLNWRDGELIEIDDARPVVEDVKQINKKEPPAELKQQHNCIIHKYASQATTL